MLTKTQIKIMKIFISSITEKYSIKQISEMLNKPYPLIYNSIQDLLEKNLLSKDKHKYIFLNYRENHQELAYIEHIRSNEIINKDIQILKNDIIKNFPYGYFVIILFGSIVNSSKPRDLDLLIIIEKTQNIEKAEKYLYNITRNYNLKIHSLIISFESVYEMLNQREDKNVMNEILNKHLILYGGELFYKLLNVGRN